MPNVPYARRRSQSPCICLLIRFASTGTALGGWSKRGLVTENMKKFSSDTECGGEQKIYSGTWLSSRNQSVDVMRVSCGNKPLNATAALLRSCDWSHNSRTKSRFHAHRHISFKQILFNRCSTTSSGDSRIIKVGGHCGPR